MCTQSLTCEMCRLPGCLRGVISHTEGLVETWILCYQFNLIEFNWFGFVIDESVAISVEFQAEIFYCYASELNTTTLRG